MEHLQNGFTLDTPAGTFPLSTDSMLLSAFVHLPKNAQVLDLGSGCGTLGVLLCAKDPNCSVTGLEIDPLAHEATKANTERNGLHGRLSSICRDFRTVPSTISPGSFHVCVSNPPYFSGGPAASQNTAARREDCCSAEELFQAAAWALRYGGDLFLVHRPERLAELIALGAKYSLEAKRLLLVRHKESCPISLILLSFRKGGKPGLKIEEATLFGEDNDPTDFYRSVYHL